MGKLTHKVSHNRGYCTGVLEMTSRSVWPHFRISVKRNTREVAWFPDSLFGRDVRLSNTLNPHRDREEQA